MCLAAVWVVACSMGASCSPRLGSPFGPTGPAAPVVLAPTPSVADLVAAVNQNTAKVQTYQAGRATISMPQVANLPIISASLAAERPGSPGLPWRVRLRAVTSVTGPEIDLGSNDERFWMWARRNEPPALFTARHDQWNGSPVKADLPIEPAWLIEALGLTTLDPNGAYQGPYPRDDAWELRAQVDTPEGLRQRIVLIDAQTAQVREQHVYDTSGALIASVIADRFRYDPLAQVSLPERVRLSVPEAQLALTINTGGQVLNAPIADGGSLWAMPQLPGVPTVDLAAGAAPASRVWDLGGNSSVYQSSGGIAKQFGSRQSVETNAQPVSVEPTVENQPPTIATSNTPSSVPQPSQLDTGQRNTGQAEFVGLPIGGRVLQ